MADNKYDRKKLLKAAQAIDEDKRKPFTEFVDNVIMQVTESNSHVIIQGDKAIDTAMQAVEDALDVVAVDKEKRKKRFGAETGRDVVQVVVEALLENKIDPNSEKFQKYATALVGLYAVELQKAEVGKEPHIAAFLANVEKIGIRKDNLVTVEFAWEFPRSKGTQFNEVTYDLDKGVIVDTPPKKKPAAKTPTTDPTPDTKEPEAPAAELPKECAKALGTAINRLNAVQVATVKGTAEEELRTDFKNKFREQALQYWQERHEDGVDSKALDARFQRLVTEYADYVTFSQQKCNVAHDKTTPLVYPPVLAGGTGYTLVDFEEFKRKAISDQSLDDSRTKELVTHMIGMVLNKFVDKQSEKFSDENSRFLDSINTVRKEMQEHSYSKEKAEELLAEQLKYYVEKTLKGHEKGKALPEFKYNPLAHTGDLPEKEQIAFEKTGKMVDGKQEAPPEKDDRTKKLVMGAGAAAAAGISIVAATGGSTEQSNDPDSPPKSKWTFGRVATVVLGVALAAGLTYGAVKGNLPFAEKIKAKTSADQSRA